MNEGPLHEDLPAQPAGHPRGRQLELGEGGFRGAVLQEDEDQAQAGFGGARAQVLGLGDCDRPAQASPGCAQASRLAGDEADRVLGDRGRLGPDAATREHSQRGGFGLQRMVDDGSEGAFGFLE